MKATLQKFTSVIGTLLLIAILFTTFAVGSLAASEESPQTGEVSINWTGGFMQSNVNKNASALGSDASVWNWKAVSGGGFYMTDVISVTKAGTTVSVTVPSLYTGSAKQMLMASFTSNWECKTASQLISGLGTYDYTKVSENYAVSVDESGAATLTGAFAFSGSSVSTNSNFTVSGSSGAYVYTYTTESDNEHFVFTSYNKPTDVTLSYSYTGEGVTQVYTTEKPSDTPSLDTSASESLTENQLAMLNEAVTRYGVTDQTTFDALCAAASAMTYNGVAARVQIGAGIRSIYTVDHNLLNAMDATRISYGAIMGVGSVKGSPVNTTEDLTVAADATEGFVATNDNAKAVVVYDSTGAAFATEKYVMRNPDGTRVFAYTTIYGETTYTTTYVRDVEMVYRAFLAVTVGDSTYILYADASGDTFGKDGAIYGAATSLYEASMHFRNDYVDEVSGEKIYAKNVILKENIAMAMDTSFSFTAKDFATADADGSVPKGTVTYYEATDTTDATVVLTTNSSYDTPNGGNYLSLTVKTAREGFYQVGMTGNTLGSQMHYIMWKNTSLPSTVKTGFGYFTNGTRIAANSTHRTNYGTALGDTWENLYTVKENFRVIPSLEETHANLGQIYLKEGTNVVSLWLSSAASASNYRASYFGLSSLSFTLVNELDVDAVKLTVYNGTTLYADGYDKVHLTDGATYPETNTGMSLGKQGVSGFVLRGSSSYPTVADRVWYNFTIENSGSYEPFLAHGGYGGLYEIFDANGEVIHSYKISDSLTAGTHSRAITYASAGEVYLAEGSYTLRFTVNKNAVYSLHQGFFFSPTDKLPTVTVNYLDAATGEAIKDASVSEYEMYASYKVAVPDIDGYIYKTHDEVYGIVEGDVVRNVYYARATTYEVYGKDMSTSGSASVVTATDGTQSVYLPIGSANKASVTVNAEIAGFYDINFIYNSLGGRVNYLYINNTSDAYGFVSEARFNGSGSTLSGTYTSADYAVTSDIAAKGYIDTTTAAIYLKKGANVLTLYTDTGNGTYYNMALYSMRVTLRDDLSGANGESLVLHTTASGAADKNYSEGGTSRLFLRNGTATTPTYGRFTLNIPTAGYYYVNALYGSSGRGYIKNVTTGEALNVNPAGTSQSVSVGGCSTAAVNGTSGILWFDAGTQTVEVGMNAGGWIAYHMLSLVKIGDHKISVSYENASGDAVADPVEKYVFDGYSYSFTSPVLSGDYTGCEPSRAVVSGIARDDVTETVIYKLPTYTVTVNYVYADGSKAADTVTAEYEKNASYAIESPTIVGYRPDVAEVSGTATADRTVTVTYTEHRVNVTMNPVDPDGNTIPGVSLGGTTVLAGADYEYMLPTVSGYIVKEDTVKGTAGEEDEVIDVVLYDAYYDFAVTDSPLSGGTHLAAGDGYLETRLLAANETVKFTVNPDVSGAYAIKAVINTAGGRTDVYTKNAIALWNGKIASGRVSGSTTKAYTFTEDDFRVAEGTATTVMTYQYLEAGKDNVVSFYFTDTRYGMTVDGTSKGYVGISSLSFTLVTPEFDTSNDGYIVTGSHTGYNQVTATSGSTTLNAINISTDATLVRSIAGGYIEYDLSIPATGIYDVNGLVCVGAVGTTTLLLTSKTTGQTTTLTYTASGKIQVADKSTSSTEVSMVDGATLYEGEYTLRMTTTSSYFAFSLLRFHYVSPVETGMTNDGEYAMTVLDKLVAVNANYYPGFTRKAITFSEDDGSAIYDPIFIALLNEYGFKGTFNLTATKSDYSLYAGHEIANHGCHVDGIKTNHSSPLALSEVLTRIKTLNDQLNSGLAANGNTRYDSINSFVHPYTQGYRFESTKVYTDESELSALASLFAAVGKNEYTAQKLGTMMEKDIFYAYLDAIGIKANRYLSTNTAYGATTNFDLPESFMYWQPTMHQSKLTNAATDGSYSNTYTNAFRDLTDDGKLKLLYIWGHSFELENEQYPDSTASSTISEADLVAFLAAFAGDEYYKDTVSGVREYVDATRSLIVTDGAITNPTSVAVYVTVSVNGGEAEEIVIGAGETYNVSFKEAILPVGGEGLSFSSSLDLLDATEGYDKTLVLKPGNALTLDLASMREGYYAVYAKLNATHAYVSEVTLTNTTATSFKTDAINAVQSANTAWSGYTTGGRILDYNGKQVTAAYDAANLDQYRVAIDNGYVLIGYQYLLSGSNTVTVNTSSSTVGVSALKLTAVAEIPSDAIHVLSGSYSYAAKNSSESFTVAHNNVWIRTGATVQYTVNIPTNGEYRIYMMAGGNSLGVSVKDGLGWTNAGVASDTKQVGSASQSHVGFALPDTLMLASGEATLTLTNGGYGKYAIITLVRVGEYVEPDSELNVDNFEQDLASGTASADVSLLAPDVYGAVLAIRDASGNILGYDALVKGVDTLSASDTLSVVLTDASDIALAASAEVFAVSEATLAEIEADALSKELAADFVYKTVDGVRLLIVSDEHYALGSKTRVGPVTGKTYTTAAINGNSGGDSDVGGQHNSYGVNSETHLQAMIDAIIAEYAKQPFDAVIYLGDMTDMDYWYKRIKNNPSAYLSDTNGDGTVDIDDLYKSDYDEIHYVKTEYHAQLESFSYTDANGVSQTGSLPVFMTLGNHDLYNDEWFFDLTKPTADYKIGTTVEVADGVSVRYVSEVDYVVFFDRNGEKDTAFFMVTSHRTAGAPLENYMSGAAATIQGVHTDATLLAEMHASIEAMLEASVGYRQIFMGCHMLGTNCFTEYIKADARIRAIYMGDSHVEQTTEIGTTGAYYVNDGCFVHTFATQYGFSYNFAAEPWAYLMLETHGTVSETYRVNPDFVYNISRDSFFRYSDESIRATAYSDELEAALLAMINENETAKGNATYATLADARSAGMLSTYATERDVLVRADFLARVYAAWTTLGLIDENTTEAEKAKMLRYDQTTVDGVSLAHITRALMFAETVVLLGEKAPGEIVKTADGTLRYVVTYRTYELARLYRGIGISPTVN